MKYKKKGLSRVLCLFIIFSLLGGGWVSSPFFLGGQAYASEASGDVIGGNDITDNNGDGEEGSGDNGENGDGEEGSGDNGENGDGEEGSGDNGENGDGEEGSGDNGENGDGEEGSGDNGENEDGEEGSGDNGENGDGEEDSGDNGENGDGEEDSDKKDEAEELNDDEEETGEVIVGDFTVSGGEQGTDYKFEGNTLIIIGSAPLVIKNTAETGFTTNNIHIGDDEHTEVTANVTLAGVRIQNTATNDSPFNIMGTDKTCYLTLAEGSVNTLNASKLFSAALHCGKNSTVVIDGSGTLNAYGGSSCSGIGSGFNEIAGKLVFNGGTINAHAFRYETTGADVPADNTLAQYNNGWAATAKHQKSGGAGIGAGGKGGASEIIINGGTIHAYGSAHGAGIGASYAFDEVGKVQLGTVGSSNADPKHLTCGDITINGGYITSKGYVHGGAFGASCGTTAKGCTITVNGGTLLPYASKSDSGGLNKDFNGVNGTVKILGGSVRSASKDQFLSAAGNGVALDANGGKVFMTTINMSNEGLANNVIIPTSWKMSIAGQEYKYGAPYSFDDGKLYLWVPENAVSKTISVTCTYIGDDGQLHELEPLYIENATNDGTAILKRYIDFELPKDKFLDILNKDYDGLPFESYDFEAEGNAIEVTEKDGEHSKTLDENKDVSVTVQRHDKINGSPIEEEFSTGGNVMPADGGFYKFTLVSKQYANDAEYKDSYWGHRATGWATINRIPSKVTDATYTVTYGPNSDPSKEDIVTQMTFKANVKQGEEKRKTTCKAPDGYIQFYVNGVPVGDPVKANTNVKTEHIDGKGDFEYGQVSLTVDFSGDKYPAIPKNEDGTFVVEAKYVGGYNYEESSAPAKKVDSTGQPEGNDKEEPENFPFINPPIPVIPNTEGDPTNPDYKPEGTELKPVEIEPIEDGTRLHGIYNDVYTRKTEEGVKVSKQDLIDFFNKRYEFIGIDGRLLVDKEGNPLKTEEITIKDANGNEITEIDLTNPGKYLVTTTVTDKDGNKATINLTYNVISSTGGGGGTGGSSDPDINVDIDGDGKPDINVDTNGDGKPDINVDTDGDGKPDVNVDTDGDGKPDVNVDTDGDGKPDVDIDTNGDGKPDVNVDTDGDGKPDINVDTDGDGKPDINVDTDGDGKPDVDIDTDGDGKPDVNVDTDGDGKPDINVDTDGDGKPDVDIDTNGDGKPDVNVDTNGDGKPDINVDTNGDGKPDINVDTNGDGKPDINIDTDKDGNPDINVDTDGDGKPDINVDTNGDGKPDINVDTDGDGKPDINVDTDGDGKPDLNVDTDGDGIPDLNVDIDGDGIPDINIDTDGDGIPDKNIKNPSEIEKLLKEKGGQDGVHGRVPKTGDENNLLAWLAMLGAAIAVLAGTMRKMRRKDS